MKLLMILTLVCWGLYFNRPYIHPHSIQRHQTIYRLPSYGELAGTLRKAKLRDQHLTVRFTRYRVHPLPKVGTKPQSRSLAERRRQGIRRNLATAIKADEYPRGRGEGGI